MLLHPMLCELGHLDQLGSLGQGWVIEEKYDGERIIAQIEKGAVHLWTRRDIDVHYKFPEVEEALLELGFRGHTILDGEVKVAGGFPTLQQRQTEDKLTIRVLSRKLPATYMLFDIPMLEGENIMRKPLGGRRESLESVLRNAPTTLVAAPRYPVQSAKQTFDAVVSKGGEGVIAKMADSPYEPGKRSRNWLKFKRISTVDVDIIGATRSDAGIPFASLMMMRDGRFFGNVGTGFTMESRKEILEILRKYQVHEPVTELPRGIDPLILTRPLPAEVKVSEISKHGTPRAPVWVRFKLLP